MHPLKELRSALGLSQQQMAAAAGIKQSQVSSHELTGKGIGPDGLVRIADKYRGEMNRLGLTVEDFIRGSRQRSAKKRKAS